MKTHGLIVVIRPNGFQTAFVVKKPPTLRRLQKMVGGYIEIVPHWDRLIMQTGVLSAIAICNEEGKLNGLPVNFNATGMWHQLLGGPGDDFLVGNIVVLAGSKNFLKVWSDG